MAPGFSGLGVLQASRRHVKRAPSAKRSLKGTQTVTKSTISGLMSQFVSQSSIQLGSGFAASGPLTWGNDRFRKPGFHFPLPSRGQEERV